jgi:hypothetical protein
MLVAGAAAETAKSLAGAGNAYLFNETSGKLIATFVSPAAQEDGYFGWSVAISGNFLVVGAPYEASGGFARAGNAYVFSTLTQKSVATLTSPDAQTGGLFGGSVAINGNLIVVGASNESTSYGKAYVFNTMGGLVSTLSSSNPQPFGNFGESVAISGKTVVVGQPQTTDPEAINLGGGFPGEAFLFNTNGTSLSTLLNPGTTTLCGEFNTFSCGSFGASVAISGKLVVIGAMDDSVNGVGFAGNAFLYTSTGTLLATLSNSNAQEFGTSVAISGKSIVVGAAFETVGKLSDAGHAYLFHTTGALVKTYASPNRQSGGHFGASASISGKLVAVGAPYESVNSVNQAGHVYVFGA